ncbi:MAG: hypothetical protein AB1792_09285 [Candidatus Zixiibacteriota bacterium]
MRGLVNYLYRGGSSLPADSTCFHYSRGDVDCDGRETIVDIVILAFHVQTGYPVLCNPCVTQ